MTPIAMQLWVAYSTSGDDGESIVRVALFDSKTGAFIEWVEGTYGRTAGRLRQ